MPFVTAHRKTYTPDIIPVIVEDGFDGVVMVGELGPLIKVQAPVPMAGALPASVVEETLHKF